MLDLAIAIVWMLLNDLNYPIKLFMDFQPYHTTRANCQVEEDDRLYKDNSYASNSHLMFHAPLPTREPSIELHLQVVSTQSPSESVPTTF
jgi:hypothetical protein